MNDNTSQNAQNEPAQSAGSPPANQSQQTQQQSIIQMKSYPASNYMQSNFLPAIAQFKNYNNRKTGYSNMDNAQPLYPGFYVLGAVSSLGKTTFAQQMADQIAENNTPVLYFSLEQSALELYSKAISRRMYNHSLSDPSYLTFSSIDIRRGMADGTRELQEQIADYSNSVGNRLITVECNFAVTVEDIIAYTEEFIKKNNVVPVVFVDYLQIVAPSIINGRPIADGRLSVDHVVHTLKSYQTIRQLTIIAICSLNRENYMVPVNFGAFKESGGIEYTADAVWGMQLSVIHDDIFNQKEKKTEKLEKFQSAQSANPRKIELVVLKNRYGRLGISFDFDYYPVHDTFIPASSGAHASIVSASDKESDEHEFTWTTGTPTPFD